MNMQEIKQDELFKKLDEAASNLSYYNAAEGNSWHQEQEARKGAEKDFNEALNAFVSKYGKETTKQVLRAGGYLVSVYHLG